MSKLPRISGRECVKALEREASTSSGGQEATLSYVGMILSLKLLSLTIRNWIGALCARLSANAGLSVDEFVELL